MIPAQTIMNFECGCLNDFPSGINSGDIGNQDNVGLLMEGLLDDENFLTDPYSS